MPSLEKKSKVDADPMVAFSISRVHVLSSQRAVQLERPRGGIPKAPSLAQFASPSTGASGNFPTSAPGPIAAAMLPSPQVSSTTSSGPDGIVKSLEVPDGEVQQLLQEANAMLKEMRQLKMLALSTTQVENMAMGYGYSPSDGRTGLLDPGASHPF